MVVQPRCYLYYYFYYRLLLLLPPAAASASWLLLQAALLTPRTTFTSRGHRVVTDKEDVQERNWLNNGKMQVMQTF